MEDRLKLVEQRLDQLESSLDLKIESMFERFISMVDDRDRRYGLIPMASLSASSNSFNNVLDSGVPTGVLKSNLSTSPSEEFESDSPLVSTTTQFFAELTSVKQKNNVTLERPNRRDSIEVPNTVLKFYDATGAKKSLKTPVSSVNIGQPSSSTMQSMVINIASFDKRLESTTLKKYLEMKQLVLEYNNMYSQNLRMAQVLSSTLLQKIFARFPRSLGSYNENVKAFIQLSSDMDIEFYISRLDLPTSTARYCAIVKDCCRFDLDEDYSLSMTSFDKYYHAAILYSSKFVEVCQLLEFCRSEDFIRTVGTLIIPNLYKANAEVHVSGGDANSRVSLVSLFLDGFPGETGKVIYNGNINELKGKRNIEEFKDSFIDILSLWLEYFNRLTSFNIARKSFVRSGKPVKFAAILSRRDNKDPKDASKQPCFARMENRKCEPNCPYSHDPKIILPLINEKIKAMQMASKQISSSTLHAIEDKDFGGDDFYSPNNSDSDEDENNNWNNPEHLGFINIKCDDLNFLHTKGFSDRLIVDCRILPLSDVYVNSVALLDTGATRVNYFPSQLFQRNRAVLTPYLKSCNLTAVLGDQKTLVNITQCLDLPIHLSCRGEGVELFDRFYIINGKDQLIIGLRTLAFRLNSFFSHVFASYVKDLRGQDGMQDELFALLPEQAPLDPNLFSGYDQLDSGHYTSVFPDTDIALEELRLPQLSYSPYMPDLFSVDPVSAMSEYVEVLETHVSPDFRATLGVMELLKTKGAKVFIANNWNGIVGEVLKLDFKDNMPRRYKPALRKINPQVLIKIKPELERLRDTVWCPSNSDICSPIVVATKATAPFYRICGDYSVFINNWITTGHYPLPDVRSALVKITGYKYFIDLDMRNSFHQIKLDESTSHLLSLQTPIGQFRPLYLPEGVSPASGILQRIVSDIFSDFDDWTIVIFDNFLILAHDLIDAKHRLEQFLDRCILRNIFLKATKSYFGFTEVKFFGYICNQHGYTLDDDRRLAIKNMPFPETKHLMQRFLGAAIFFKPFVIHYSTLSAPLTSMLNKDFDYEHTVKTPEKKSEFVSSFDKFKQALYDCLTLIFPDYDLEWILRCDASKFGIGAVLFQIRKLFIGCALPPGMITDSPSAIPATRNEVIALVSQKFSKHAINWATIVQECYAIYYAVHTLSAMLRCKSFTVETDHANLLWMRSSTEPKIMRMCGYLQSFLMAVRHIAGRHNELADELSRNMAILTAISTSHMEMIAKCHNYACGHLGKLATYLKLNREYPGHGVSMAEIREFIDECLICQKVRATKVPTILPRSRSLAKDAGTVAIDTAQFEEDVNGNRYVFVIVNLFTRLTHLFPAKDKSTNSAAMALYQYFVFYGGFSVVHSDPGSEFTSGLFSALTVYLNSTKTFSIVNNPWADGVEPTVKQMKRHLVSLCTERRFRSNWSSPTVLTTVQYILNSRHHSQIDISPYKLTFGDLDRFYERFPNTEKLLEASGKNGLELLEEINDNLQFLRKRSKEFEQTLLDSRNTSSEEPSNAFQVGDFVFQVIRDKLEVPSLRSSRRGPYRIAGHTGTNKYSVFDLIDHVYYDIDVRELVIFSGSAEEALELAKHDKDDYTVEKILGYTGTPLKRSEMQFLVKFVSGTILFLDYRAVVSTAAFDDFISENHYLGILRLPSQNISGNRSLINKASNLYSIGYKFYMNLRAFGAATYSSLECLGIERYQEDYYILAEVRAYIARSNNRKLNVFIEHLRLNFEADGYFMHMHGRTTVKPNKGILVTEAMVKKFGLKSKLKVVEDESRKAETLIV
jgi:hypothetical protein